jgi:hypothetical protein
MAIAYRGNGNTTDGYYPTPGKYKKTAGRDGKQNLRAISRGVSSPVPIEISKSFEKSNFFRTFFKRETTKVRSSSITHQSGSRHIGILEILITKRNIWNNIIYPMQF